MVLSSLNYTSAQTPNVLWNKTYNGPANGFDFALDCIQDNANHLFVVGYSSNGNNDDILIVNYNTTNGDTIWTRRYNSPANEYDMALGCVVDNTGNLFVVGASMANGRFDYITMKYNSTSGDTIWTRRYNGTANGDDMALECALDDSGNIFVTGVSFNGLNNDYVTIKYRADNGTMVWLRSFDNTAHGKDEAYGCAADPLGNVYVNGYSFNGTSYNLVTLKYNSAGEVQWTRTSLDTLDSVRTVHSDCTVDESMNIYVSGMCGIELNSGNRYGITLKYTSSGNLEWTTRYDSPQNYDQFLGSTIDHSGNLYLSGSSYNGSNDDILLLKLNASTGNTIWSLLYNDQTQSHDYGLSCAIDVSGYLYVSGATTSSNTYDYITIKYNTGSTSVNEIMSERHSSYLLFQNFPNPFNPTTILRYEVPENSLVALSIFNTTGEKVANLVNEFQSKGNHEILFDASLLPSGMYYAELQVGKLSEVKKLVLVK